MREGRRARSTGSCGQEANEKIPKRSLRPVRLRPADIHNNETCHNYCISKDDVTIILENDPKLICHGGKPICA